MKIRCDIHLGSTVSKVLLVPRPEEKDEHLALKLAAYLMFLAKDPIVEPSADHPCLSGITHRPDVCTLDAGGQINLWVDCGSVTLNKLDKVTRRLPGARVIVLKASLREAQRLRRDLQETIKHETRIEIWTWPDGLFDVWLHALNDKTEVYGDAHEKSFNLVVNEIPYAVDLVDV